VALSFTVETDLETAVPITLLAEASEGSALTYLVQEGPAHGTLEGVPPEVIYSPDQAYVGADQFTYTVSDGLSTSAEAVVSIEVASEWQVVAADGSGDFLELIEAELQGRKTLIRAGIYLLETGITISSPDTVLRGEDRETVILRQSDPGYDLLRIYADNVGISRLTLDAQTHDAQAAFVAADCSNVSLEDSLILGSSGIFAVYFAGPSLENADDCDDADASTINDMDCDASLTADDCDDDDPDIYPWDRDGDGIDEGCGWLVSAGYHHTCGIKSDGSVECRGLDSNGQSTPPAGTFESVSAGWYYTCGITTSGSVECWGHDGYLQSSSPFGTFVSVSAGYTHTCGVTSGGSVECWGWGAYGQSTPPTGTSESVSANKRHTCGVTSSGSVECWGQDNAGQSTPPTGTFDSVSAGKYHTCGVTSSGSVECWGIDDSSADDYGQVTDAPPGTFQSVSAGKYHTCGVTSSGSVECWGLDDYGQVTNTPPGTFESVSAGRYHTCAVASSSSVECWGDDTYGQSTPPSCNFETVGAGVYHSCGIKTDGTVACWGREDGSSRDYGQVSNAP
jgi:hypothetical protein